MKIEERTKMLKEAFDGSGEDQKFWSVHTRCDNMLTVHVRDAGVYGKCKFEDRNDKDYPVEKSIIINGVKLFSLHREEGVR